MALYRRATLKPIMSGPMVINSKHIEWESISIERDADVSVENYTLASRSFERVLGLERTNIEPTTSMTSANE